VVPDVQSDYKIETRLLFLLPQPMASSMKDKFQFNYQKNKLNRIILESI